MSLTRKEVLRLMFKAQTLPEIDQAEQAVMEFLETHPDDPEILGNGELLIMKRLWRIPDTKDEVLALIYKARTLLEVIQAEQAVTAWLEIHPDDYEVRSTAELLIRTREALPTEQPSHEL